MLNKKEKKVVADLWSLWEDIRETDPKMYAYFVERFDELKPDVEKMLENKVKNLGIKSKLLTEVEKEDVPESDVKAFEIAKAFYKLFESNLIEMQSVISTLQKSKYGSFVSPIRLMIDNDGVTDEQFRKLWEFLKRDQFWKKNILSTSKLRKQAARLLAAYNSKTNDKANVLINNGAATGVSKINDDYIRKVQQELGGVDPK